MPFDTMGLRPELLRALKDLGFTEPTPVQAAAIPPALAGRDVLASAATGSGKTAAFGLPLLQALADQPRGVMRALILAPTRELAAQITEHLTKLAAGSKIRIATIVGGVGFSGQVGAFKRGTEIIVATPGRLLDHIAQGTCSLGSVEYLVLDEADRMLDMGFLPVVKRIVKMLVNKKQTLFFSATLPPAITELVNGLLKDPARVDLAPVAAPAAGITQTIYSIDQQRKPELFLELLKDNQIYSAICFTRTKARANRLAALLAKNNVPAERIHGDRSQAQRTRALDDFKRGKFRVLVATDIAARGIDIIELGHVVNFDVPMVPEDYVHRVGRTGRNKASGDAITFVAPDEEKLFREIEKILGRRIDRAKTPELPAVSTIVRPAATADNGFGPRPPRPERRPRPATAMGARRPQTGRPAAQGPSHGKPHGAKPASRQAP